MRKEKNNTQDKVNEKKKKQEGRTSSWDHFN